MKKYNLRIGLPKGRFLALSEKLEFNLQEKLNIAENQKIIINFYYLKASDIAYLIKLKKIDYGITCEEWIWEYTSKGEIIADTRWCYSKIALLGKDDKEVSFSKGTSICTPFLHLTKKLFIEHSGVKIFKITGSTECLINAVFDYAVDCIETGATIKKYNLDIKKTFFETKTVLVRAREDAVLSEFENLFIKAIHTIE